MMMKTVAFLACMALVRGDAFTALGDADCGNCQYQTSDGLRRCNTKNFDPLRANEMPYSRHQDKTPKGFFQYSNATAMKVTELATIVGATAFDMMFCGAYLRNFRDGQIGQPEQFTASTINNGAVCVTSWDNSTNDEPVKKAIMEADEDARKHFELFGTSNGYASSFAVSKGNSQPEEFVRWGSGGLGDVPMNWCGTYMKYMLCSIAFPQVAMSEQEIDKERRDAFLANPDASQYINTKGKLRPVELDSCEGMFRVCNRREPSSDEQKDSYIPMEVQTEAGNLIHAQEGRKINRKMDNGAWCELWSEGFGLSLAGTGIADAEETVQFEAASLMTSSTLVTLVLLVIQMLL